MGDDGPLVTVMLPTLNAMPYVVDAVASLQAQTLSDVQILVVDGGSTDGTRESVAAMAVADSRISLIDQPGSGIADARNTALSRARGPLVACLDADDVAASVWLERQIRLLKEHRWTYVSCNVRYLRADGKPLRLTKRHRLRDELAFDPLVDGNVPNQGCVFLRESALRVGGYRLNQGEDYDLLLRLAEVGTLGFNPEVLVCSRILGTGMTIRGFEDQRIAWMYARDCALARRGGTREPSFGEWLEQNQRRLQAKRRRWRAQLHWTRAGEAVCAGKHATAAILALRSLIADPRHAMGKIRTYGLRSR